MSFPRVQPIGEFWEAVRTPGEARERQFPRVQLIRSIFDAAEKCPGGNSHGCYSCVAARSIWDAGVQARNPLISQISHPSILGSTGKPILPAQTPPYSHYNTWGHSCNPRSITITHSEQDYSIMGSTHELCTIPIRTTGVLRPFPQRFLHRSPPRRKAQARTSRA